MIIAGAGPVGTTLAMDLARFDVPAIVVERQHGIVQNPRCNTINARSMELLRRLGCADAVRAAGLPEDAQHRHRLHDASEWTRARSLRRSTAADVRRGTQHGVAANWPTRNRSTSFLRFFLEPVLRTHAVTRWGVDLREEWELTSFTQVDDAVTLSPA